MNSDCPKGGFAFPLNDGMTLRDWLSGMALGALHGHVSDIFVNSLVPPDAQSDEETRAYYVKRVNQLADTVVAIADAVMLKLKGDSND